MHWTPQSTVFSPRRRAKTASQRMSDAISGQIDVAFMGVATAAGQGHAV